MAQHPLVPFFWARIPSSPPRERRDEVREICRRRGARLAEDQIYYDAEGMACALIEVSVHEAEQQALLDDLSPLSWVGLVNADEYADGTRPPESSES